MSVFPLVLGSGDNVADAWRRLCGGMAFAVALGVVVLVLLAALDLLADPDLLGALAAAVLGALIPRAVMAIVV